MGRVKGILIQRAGKLAGLLGWVSTLSNGYDSDNAKWRVKDFGSAAANEQRYTKNTDPQ